MTEPLLWHRLRGIRPALSETLFNYVLDTYGWAGVFEAWDEFQGFHHVEYDENSPELQVFVPWLLFDWMPMPGETHVPLALPTDLSPAALCLGRRPEALDPLARQFVAAACEAPFSFFEVLAVEPAHGLTLRDLLTGTEREVLEKKGSLRLQVGDVTFAKPVPIEDITVLEAMAHFKMPPTALDRVQQLAKKITRRRPLAEADLPDQYPEIFGAYRDLRDELFKPKGVEMVDSDGGLPN